MSDAEKKRKDLALAIFKNQVYACLKYQTDYYFILSIS